MYIHCIFNKTLYIYCISRSIHRLHWSNFNRYFCLEIWEQKLVWNFLFSCRKHLIHFLGLFSQQKTVTKLLIGKSVWNGHCNFQNKHSFICFLHEFSIFSINCITISKIKLNFELKYWKCNVELNLFPWKTWLTNWNCYIVFDR